jgi:uncharacterized Fe-S cluster-containing radical SAM superfamily protein
MLSKRSRVEPNIGLSRAAGIDPYRERRRLERLPHDGLHVGQTNAPASGHCGCLCSHCWLWSKSTFRKRGVCICLECPCGGSLWYPRSSARNG